MSKAQSGIKIDVDFSGIAKAIGAGEAMVESISNNSPYIDAVIDAAFSDADNEFNSEAVAYATAGGQIKHMFEWGTSGINRGRSDVRPNPNSERARLWKTISVGTGMNRLISFTFKPSLGTVPKPTVAGTGMSSEVISKLRDHVFQWKAMVLETGALVTIEPVNAKFLLLPFYNGAPPGSPPSRVNRGYNLIKGPVTFQPGANVQGNFTSYWTTFWEGRGGEMVNMNVQKQILQDFEQEFNINTSRTPTQARPGAVDAMVDAEKTKVKTRVNAKAKTRRTV